MNILLTGASSFTGYWFARELAEAGHEVTAPLRRAFGDFTEGARSERVKRLRKIARVIESCSFGAEVFQNLLRTGRFELLCHHAAVVENYRSLDFNVAKALNDNILNLSKVLSIGQERGLRAVVLTGSVFEQGEGAGSQPLLAFSPYALSKGATADVFRFWCARLGIKLAKFVIPNPFGPFEEPRFCAYLMQCWSRGETALIKTPIYVRDNIHVSLLARAYVALVASLDSMPIYSRHSPSGYVETQGAFAQRFAREIGRRLDIECAVDLQEQGDFDEPLVRINTEPCDHSRLSWAEVVAWDELAEYYKDNDCAISLTKRNGAPA